MRIQKAFSFVRRLAALAALALPLAVAAQSWPAQPIKLIVPFPPGSSADASARLMSDELRKSLGQQVLVENVPGADGILAAQAAKRAPADGYTLFLSTNSTHAANLSLHAKLPYDPEKDFVPIAGYVSVPMVLLVKPDFPAADVAGFVKLAGERAATGKPLSYGSGNTGGQVAAALLSSAAKVKTTHVPYKGSAQALQDLVGGHVDFLFTDAFSPMALVNDGKLRVLGVADSKRHPLLQQVPTMAEAGFRDVHVVAWNGYFAPAGTPGAVIERLHKEISTVLARQETADALQKMGLTPMPMAPAEMRGFVGSEIVRWQKNIELAGIEKK
jgi:tripartite-type tricarboxylate transporter receptor subunit TctC